MTPTSPLIAFDDQACRLFSPTALPRASGFLWNRKMMLHMTARGFATAQFMQPEPAKYAHAPNLEAKTFMQPEQPYYAHHPGRFFYVRDREDGALFSAPHEPVRKTPDHFEFTQYPERIEWCVRNYDIEISLTLTLPVDEACELWAVQIRNIGDKPRKLSLYPYFPFGYMSWMNQSARFDAGLNAIIASSVTPYQKVADYFKNKHLKDLSFFAADQTPTAFETRREDFEGEGGLRDPDMLRAGLQNTHAHYETPAAIMQFDVDLAAGESHVWHFVFGPAFDKTEIAAHINAYLGKSNFDKALIAAKTYIEDGRGVLNIATLDTHFDAFVNSWLARQVYYHGDTNRLTTDPQIRNYLQDAMGMVYIRPEAARAALLRTFSQQNIDGSMPDGVTLYEGAELKYINQVPHSDHCVWLPILLEAYTNETGDYGLLDEDVAGQSIRTRMNAAMQWLIKSRDDRGLSFIDQGDWCDPMNMVGYKGKGVSGWLTLASAYALQLWAKLSGENAPWLSEAEAFNKAASTHMWDGDWYGRGITDDGVLFGVKTDDEGRIYVNPQSFAMLSGAANADQIGRMTKAVEAQLETPYGVEMLGKPYTKMRDDVGRLTQKTAGSAENGAVYNHAGAFYIYSLYQAGFADKGFDLLSRMLTGPDDSDYLQRGQLPVFIPNYYRGDHKANPRTSGRSSQLFNTGTISWIYRIVIEGLFGLKGSRAGLNIAPNLPSHWDTAHVTRSFRGAQFDIGIRRDPDLTETVLEVDGVKISGTLLTDIETGRTYQVHVSLPTASRI